jgi:hypothetical protein
MTPAHPALFEAARAAAGSFPVAWQQQEGVWHGTFDGRHGDYDVAIATPNDRVFAVRAVSHASVAADVAARIARLCLDATWTMPTAGFYRSRAAGGAVVSAATLTLHHCTEPPEASILQNTLRECLLNAELFAAVAPSVARGASIDEARELRRLLFPALAAGELGGLPPSLVPGGRAPAGAKELLDACEVAAGRVGWPTERAAPDELVVDRDTFVGVESGCIVVSSYPGLDVAPERIGAVSEELNGLLDEGAPVTLALDPVSGTVVARSFLDVRGLPQIPDGDVLCDVIRQAGGGAAAHIEQLERAADRRPSGPRPFGSGTTGPSLRDRLQSRAA